MQEVVPASIQLPCARNERGRIELWEGDFLGNSLGDNVDVVLLSDVMYEESTTRIVLRNAWNGLSQNGMLVVRGCYADPERLRPIFGALFAFQALADSPQRKALTISTSEKEVRETGFRINVVPLTEFSFVLVGRKE